MLRVDDWFIKSRTTIYGQDRDREIRRFDLAGLRGFMGEGGARDAQTILRQQGKHKLSLVRIEMRLVKPEESSKVAFGNAWIILMGMRDKYLACGQTHPFANQKSDGRDFVPYSDFEEMLSIAAKYNEILKEKPVDVLLATWNLYAL